MTARPSVVVYGASGYTGRQVARELVQRGARTLVAGRTHRKLAALADELGGEVEIRTAALDDVEALRSLCAEGDVVVNCAGPFTRTASAVVDAALAARTHYVDITAEQLASKPVFERDAEARAAGIALLPATAVFGALAPLGALVALGDEPVESLEIVWSVKNWRPSWTTLEGRLEGMRSPWYVWEDGGPSERRGWPATLHFDFPSLGRRRVGVYPTPDALTVPRAVRASRVRTLMTTSTISQLGPALPFSANVASRLLRSPLAGVTGRLLGLSWRSLGKDEKTDDPTPFVIVLVADGSPVAEISGRGIYDLTAPIAAETAMRVAEPSFGALGALSVAEAVDAGDFLGSLERRGVRFQEIAAARSAASSSKRASGSSSSSPSRSRSRAIR